MQQFHVAALSANASTIMLSMQARSGKKTTKYTSTGGALACRDMAAVGRAVWLSVC